MILKPSIKPRERILTFGAAGTGKSHAALTIARKTAGTTFVIDNDLAYERLIATDFTDIEDRVEVFNLDEWDEYIPALREINTKAERDDWLVVDSMTPTWSQVQSAFVEKIHGKEIDDYFLQVRRTKQDAKKGSPLGALEGWMDWPVINSMYFKLYRTMLKFPGHVYCTAEMGMISSDDTDKDTRLMFGGWGVKPIGQKRLPHIYNTVLIMKKTRVGEWTMTTTKDRGREDMDEEEVGDFAMTYLRGVAGWKMGKR